MAKKKATLETRDRSLGKRALRLRAEASPGGREQISHPPNGHDDCAVACAGVVELALRGSTGLSFEAIYAPGAMLGLPLQR